RLSARANWKNHVHVRPPEARLRAVHRAPCGACRPTVPWLAFEDIRAKGERGVSRLTQTLPSFVARCPRLTGWKSGCLTGSNALVGSTLYADRRPPLSAC